MKTTLLIVLLWVGVTCCVAWAQPGLTGEYFDGTNFERKILTRLDPQISFDWQGRSPAAGLGESYFSVRWTGKLLAPATGRYVFSALVDDGIRVWVGNRNVIDAWALHDDVSVRGAVILEAGKYYDLRVDYFNDMLEGKINLIWQRPDEPNSPSAIAGQYLYRTIPRPKPALQSPVKPAPKPVVAVVVANPNVSAKPIQATPVAPAKPRETTVTSTPPPVTPIPTPEKPVAATFDNLESGKTLVLQSVFFEQSTYVLLPESFPELDKLVRTLQQHPTVRIEIAGHTDNVGDPRRNRSLSEYRARVVMNYLVRHGIAEERITAMGYGDSRPLTGNATELERAQNRRVEFIVK